MPVSGLTSTAAEFNDAVATAIFAFEETKLIKRVANGVATLVNYHDILVTLFHQTWSGPYTFAKAAANCQWKHAIGKEYLLRHAEEEKAHWRWVLDDLRNTAYAGLDPREMFPHPTCEAFISFNEKIADRMPVARLAIASVLEGIGGRFGGTYGRKLLDSLGLSNEQASFFVSHGETDKVHMRELSEAISACELTPHEWGWMTYAARIGGDFYAAMYSHDAFS